MILDPEFVARQGIEGCLRGRPTVTPGFFNRLLMYGLQLFPKMRVTRLIGIVYRRSFITHSAAQDKDEQAK